MTKPLEVVLAFLLLWIVSSIFLFVYYGDTLSWKPDRDYGVHVNVVPTTSDWTNASTIFPITSTHGDPMAVLEPIQVLRQYQKEHSSQALQQDSVHVATDRKFLVAYYYGPHRAGNILHNFFNSIIWGVATNRTVLWEYYVDRPHTNTVQDCEQYLKRNPWLPSYTEWSRKLQLATPIPARVRDMLSASAQVVVAPQIRDLYPENGKIDRVKWSDDPAYLLQQEEKRHQRYRWRSAQWLFGAGTRNDVVVSERESIRRFYSHGLIFLYGMLFQECFTIAVNTTAITVGGGGPSTFPASVSLKPRPTDTSIALHSRHTVAQDDGSYINHEIACLQKLLPAQASTPCWVYLMSDRPKTLELLSGWLLARNCTPVVTSASMDISISIDTAIPQPRVDEHGPREGAGFLEDLIMASAARTGFIGVEARQQGLPARSSTALVLEKIEYDRTVEAVASIGSGNTRSTIRYHELQLSTLQRCAMSFRDETKGYNYGPGTPLFRRNETWIEQLHEERNEKSRAIPTAVP